MIRRLARTIINSVTTLYYALRYYNRISIGENCVIKHIKIKGYGKVIVQNNVCVDSCVFIFWGNEHDVVEIGDNAIVYGIEFIESHGSSNSICVGKNTTIGGGGRLRLSKGLRL